MPFMKYFVALYYDFSQLLRPRIDEKKYYHSFFNKIDLSFSIKRRVIQLYQIVLNGIIIK